jgi:predicted amidohydrolase
MSVQMVRVAAAQFSNGTDVSENLATVLRMIDLAALEQPEVMVLPEFCNHLSIYDDGQHAWDVAIELGTATEPGPWIVAVGERAARHKCWIQLNCTVRRDGASTSREAAPGRITNTNMMFSPSGELVAANDKTVLMGAEGDFLSAAQVEAELIETPFATVGTYACMDGVIPEVPRGLVLRGATLLLNSLNSFALDEASLHVPARAAENKVWVVACCKVGPLLPPEKVALFSSAMNVPPEFLNGAGESQIVAPDGTVVAIGPREGESVVVADIDLSAALDKRRPDGTDVIAARRPPVYEPLSKPTPMIDEHVRAASVTVEVVGTIGAIGGAGLTVLGELAITPDDVESVSARLEVGQVVVTSMKSDGVHLGVVIDSTGVIGEQRQLHRSERHSSWHTTLGDSLTPIDLAWGRLAIIVGDDAIYPESARLAALANCDVLAVPFTQLEEWETSIGLVERAAENRVCLVAANSSGESLIVSLPPDFTLWSPSRERVFDGTINRPDVLSGPAPLCGVVHPDRAVNRQISKGTNLVDGRPWQLAGSLTDR